MRVLLTSLVLILSFQLLSAQTWELPEVVVPVESPIKAYIYKKPVVYGSANPDAELSPVFLPRLAPAFIKAENPLYIPPLSYTAGMSVNHNAENSSHFAIYPYRSLLRRTDLKLGWQPRRDLRSSFKGRIEAYSMLNQNKIELSGNIYNAELGGYAISLNQAGIDHASPGSSNWSDLHTKLAYAFINQTDVSELSSGELEFMHSGLVNSLGQSLAYKLMLEHERAAFLLDYSLPIPGLRELKPSLSLLSDLKHVIPSAGFSYQFSPAPDHSIFLKQTSSLGSNSYSRLLDLNPWQSLTQRPPVILKPLDLTLAWEYRPNPFEQKMLRRGRLELTSSYSTGAGYYLEQATSIIPKLDYSDQFATALKFKAELEDKGFNLQQDIALSLSYLDAVNWQRAAYSPLLELNSILSRNWDKYSFSLSLEQRYDQHDQHNRHLKDTVDMSLQGKWKLCRDWQLSLIFNRIFGSKLIRFNSLPAQGRELWLGISYYGR